MSHEDSTFCVIVSQQCCFIQRIASCKATFLGLFENFNQGGYTGEGLSVKHLPVVLTPILLLLGCSTPSAVDLHTQPITVIKKVPDVIVRDVPGIFTMAGRYTEEFQPLSDGVNAIQATVRLFNPRSDPKWAPLCSIILMESEKDISDRAGETANGKHEVRLRLKAGRAPNLLVDETVNKTEQLQMVVLADIIPIGAATPVRMWWLNGELVVEENGKTRTKIVINWPIWNLAFIGSNSDCRFSDITLGTMGK